MAWVHDFAITEITTAGFAKLIPLRNNSEIFTQEVINFLHQFLGSEREEIGKELFKQVEFANSNYTWTKRALEWEKFLLTT